MKKFRIGYFADGPWSHLAFEKLIEDSSIEIAFIVPRTDTTDTTLLEYSKTYDINYITPATGSSSTRTRRQAGSHGRSQVRPSIPGNTFECQLTM